MANPHAPYHPIIYVRGFAGTQGEIDETVGDPYMGFNIGSTKSRQVWDGKLRRYYFESPLVRLKDEPIWKATPAEQRLADPQIIAALGDLQRIPKDKIPERVAKRLGEAPPALPITAMANLRTVWDAGITVVMGTDAGNIGTVHGPSVFREMALMQLARLTPLQVLRSATTNGARATGKEKELGTIAPGKLADLVILDGDPLAGVDNLSRIWRVFKDGQVYDPDELIQSIR